MYRDNTLIPSEAVRLLALGILATRPATYAEVARSVRDFSGHVVGPSLDLIGSPIELLKVEGLIEGPEDEDDPDAEELRITEAGRAEVLRLLNANVRAPVTDINKLILAVKLRFLHLLPPDQQRLKAIMLADMCERELVRLIELRGSHKEESGHFISWLDHDIAEVGGRLAWFRSLADRLAEDGPGSA